MKLFYLLSIILISCLGTIVYSNTFSCPFQFDDDLFIVHNPAIRNIHHLQNIWNYIHGRCITLFSLALNYHFNGLNVFGYHLVNLVVHLLSACFIWWLTLMTLSTPVMKDNKISQHAPLIALFAGLILVCHPLQTEAVTYIWQRAASMAALFYLASLCFYVKSRLPSSGFGRFYYVLSLVMAIVAMFTKENAVTLPLMILLYERTFFKTMRSLDWKYISPFLLTLFIIPVTFLFMKSQTFQQMHGNLGLPGGGVITPMHYFLTQFRAMFTYIRLAFLPVNQNFDYDYPLYTSIFQLPVLVSFLFLVFIFYAAVRLFSKYRLLSFSIFWFFVTLIIPESSFWAMGDLIYEHRLYLPLAGYSIFLVASVYYLWGKSSIRTMIIILSLITVFYSVLTYQRNKVWANEFTLWDDAVQKSPHKARPYYNRGIFYVFQGNYTQAMPDLNKAIEINPGYTDALNNRSVIYSMRGDYSVALSDLNKIIEINPSFADAYNNRGIICVKLGKYTQAISDFTKAIELDPSNKEAYQNRVIAHSLLKKQGSGI